MLSPVEAFLGFFSRISTWKSTAFRFRLSRESGNPGFAVLPSNHNLLMPAAACPRLRSGAGMTDFLFA